MNYLGIKEPKLTETVDKLNDLLSNYQVYYQNLRAYHWNISGPHFFDLHEIFEDLYNEAKSNIDEIAERVLTLRKVPISTLKEYLAISDIEEMPTKEAREMVSNIIHNHHLLIAKMRNVLSVASEVNDEGTIDLISSFLSNIEKKSWMLDAWLNRS